MQYLPPFTIESVRGLMFALVPTVHTNISAMLATDEHASEVRDCCEFFNFKREYWLTLTDERELLADSLLTWQTLNPAQFVHRASMLRFIVSVLALPTFPWYLRDAEPLPTAELLHLDRDCLPTLGAWWFYLETKAWLRDPSVVPEIAATWDDSSNSNLTSPNFNLIGCLAYCVTDSAIDLLRDRSTKAAYDGDRQAAQLELSLLRELGISPPPMTDHFIEGNGIALQSLSLQQHTAHPALLRLLQPGYPGHSGLQAQCLRRPHLRQLCRGSGDWHQNLIRYLATPHNDLPL